MILNNVPGQFALQKTWPTNAGTVFGQCVMSGLKAPLRSAWSVVVKSGFRGWSKEYLYI